VADRTGLYQRLVKIELDWLGDRRRVLPKVKKTIADMIVRGSPPFSGRYHLRLINEQTELVRLYGQVQ